MTEPFYNLEYTYKFATAFTYFVEGFDKNIRSDDGKNLICKNIRQLIELHDTLKYSINLSFKDYSYICRITNLIDNKNYLIYFRCYYRFDGSYPGNLMAELNDIDPLKIDHSDFADGNFIMIRSFCILDRNGALRISVIDNTKNDIKNKAKILHDFLNNEEFDIDSEEDIYS